MLGNYLQQTPFLDLFFLGALRVKQAQHHSWTDPCGPQERTDPYGPQAGLIPMDLKQD